MVQLVLSLSFSLCLISSSFITLFQFCIAHFVLVSSILNSHPSVLSSSENVLFVTHEKSYRTHKICESVCTNRAVTAKCVFEPTENFWGAGGVRTLKMVKQWADVSCSKFGKFCQCSWTGDRRAGRGFVKMGNEDLHQVCSHSPKNKLSGAVRPATLFTWPHTNRLFTIPWNKTRPQKDFRASRASRRT